MAKYQAPRGTRDFLPQEMAVRNHVEKAVRAVFESYGFQQIQTPIFEQYELLAARSGEEIKESMFTFASDAGRYVTSAGVSAGTDLGFYLVSRLAGRAVAEIAAAAAEYDWRRDPETPIFYPQQAEV